MAAPQRLVLEVSAGCQLWLSKPWNTDAERTRRPDIILTLSCGISLFGGLYETWFTRYHCYCTANTQHSKSHMEAIWEVRDAW